MSHIQAGAERGGCPPAVRCRAVRRAGARAASRAVLFLAANDYVTGAALPVDGGEHLVGPINH